MADDDPVKVSGEPDDLMTAEEVIAWLRISPHTLEDWHRRGVVPFYGAASIRIRRYSRSELVAWLKRKDDGE